MNVRPKRICVIGAGLSGLCSIKNCLESELDVVCYEKSNDIGGLWNYGKNTGNNQATVAESTWANTSKEMFAFSDFPPPADWPNWMHNRAVCQYLKLYAEKFNLLKYIRLNTAVQKLKMASDYQQTGRWEVHLSDGVQETFDGVMVCSGQHSRSYMPDFEGLDSFKGSIIHSQMYRNWEPYENKRVLVVGIGNSSMDVATELSRLASQVYLSTRRGSWIWGCMGIRGWPVDVRYLSRLADQVFTLTPTYMLNSYFEHVVNMKMDHTEYGLKPRHRFWSQQPVFGDEVANCIANGSLIIKDAVKQVQDHSAVFMDDTVVDIDAVIFCTGYRVSFPFLDDYLVPVNNDGVNLYKNVFPPHLAHATLAFIGFVQSFGGLGPMSEMQGRWATRLFKNEIQLPPRNEMENDIKKCQKWIKTNFYRSSKHIFQTSYIHYMNDLASIVGVRPSMIKLLITDPKLFYSCYVGPCTSYTYRLTGPNSWPEARNTILATIDRIDQPLKTRRGYPAVFKPFDPFTMSLQVWDWSVPLLIMFCWITFGTDNDLLFHINVIFLFILYAIFAALTEGVLDLATDL